MSGHKTDSTNSSQAGWFLINKDLTIRNAADPLALTAWGVKAIQSYFWSVQIFLSLLGWKLAMPAHFCYFFISVKSFCTCLLCTSGEWTKDTISFLILQHILVLVMMGYFQINLLWNKVRQPAILPDFNPQSLLMNKFLG